MLHPDWLNTFKVLVETGHFTETAQKLFMTQPGVSQHINKLEASCKHTLLIRNKKKFELTEQGRLVYEYAKNVARHETDLLAQLNFDNPFAGHCKLACSGAMALRLYPALLKLQVAHPKLIIQLEVAPNQNILNSIKSGDIDFGIVTREPDKQLFEYQPLGHDELCLILPNKPAHKDNILQSIQSLGLINHPDAQHYLSVYFSQCGQSELAAININTIPISGYINQLVQILTPVTQGLGFTVLPKSAFESFANKHELTLWQAPHAVKEPLIGVKARYRQLPARYNQVIAELEDIIAHF